MGERADTRSAAVIESLNKSIDQGLSGLRRPFDQEFGFLSKSGLQQFLRSMGNDESLLTYHINKVSARVWVGNRSGVQQLGIPRSSGLHEDILRTRVGLADAGISSFERNMTELGNRLITPVAHLLTETVYIVPAGALLGFPFDALRFKERHLFENHRFINLTSFPSNVNPAGSLKAGALERVFLAGHPQDYSSSYLSRLDTSTEISVVADIFVGPGLSIIQGTALLPDEFQSEQLQQANLVHLTMPGVINLKYPEQSSFELSGNEYNLERASIGPAEIRQQNLTAKLVFLSTTRMKEYSLSAFTHQAALISDLHHAGARAVIAGLWSLSGNAAEGFISDFYRRLERSDNIATALQAARLQYLGTNRENGLYDWASVQLFIN